MRSRGSGNLVFATLLAWTLFTSATAADAGAAEITVHRVSGSVYVLEIDGTNVAASVGNDGVVLVDVPSLSTADRLFSALRQITDKPIRYVINTHAHGDHTGGNRLFRQLAPIIAHEHVRARIAGSEQELDALPTLTFSNELTLHINGETIKLLKIPAGHTDGDVVVFFSESNVVHMGDAFMPPAASFVDRTTGGTILGLIGALEFVLPEIRPDAKIVPGHGAVATRADVAKGLEVLRGMKSVIEKGIESQKSMDQLVAEKAFDQWRGLTISNVPLDSYIGRFYRELNEE